MASGVMPEREREERRLWLALKNAGYPLDA